MENMTRGIKKELDTLVSMVQVDVPLRTEKATRRIFDLVIGTLGEAGYSGAVAYLLVHHTEPPNEVRTEFAGKPTDPDAPWRLRRRVDPDSGGGGEA